MSDSNREKLTVAEAVSRLDSIVKDVEAKGRSDAHLKAILVETILIIDAWNSRGQVIVDKKMEWLRKAVQHKQGRLGSIHSLLLRAAFGKGGVDSRKTGGWGKACENLAARMVRKKIKVGKMTVEAEFMKFGIEQARRNEFD